MNFYTRNFCANNRNKLLLATFDLYFMKNYVTLKKKQKGPLQIGMLRFNAIANQNFMPTTRETFIKWLLVFFFFFFNYTKIHLVATKSQKKLLTATLYCYQ